MAALDRAFALAEIDGVAVLVGEQLHFDVARVGDELLDINFIGVEGALGLAAGALVGGFEFALLMDEAHALAAAAGGGLEHDGIADGAGDGDGFVETGERLGGAGDAGDAGLLHRLAGAGLRAHHLHGGGGRADEGDAGVIAGADEGGVLGEEAIAGMDGFGPAAEGDFEDLVDVQIGFAGGRGAEEIGFVGVSNVERGAVDVGVNGDGGDAEFAAGADDADGDLSAVGDEDLAEGFGAHGEGGL